MDTLRIKKVLVPTDFSEPSYNAVKTAVAVCMQHHASITLLNVYEKTSNFILPYSVAGYQGDVSKRTKMIRTNKLRRLADQIQVRNNLTVEAEVHKGNVAEIISTIAIETKMDMIVMGTHGSHWLKRESFMGTITYNVVKYAYVPVLIVPAQGSWTNFKKIIFPVRTTTNASEKYETIHPIITKNNSRLIVLALAEGDHPSQLFELNALLRDLKSRLKDEGISYETELHYGNEFPEKILDTAESYCADLIVINASNKKNNKNVLVNTYLQRIVNVAKTPVLAVKFD